MIHAILQLLWLLPVLANQPVDPAHARTEEILRGMSLEQKVGQLMMVGFGGRTMGPEISRLLLDHHKRHPPEDSKNSTSMSTPTTVARAAPEERPKSVTEVAIATSKWLEAPIIAVGAASA